MTILVETDATLYMRALSTGTRASHPPIGFYRDRAGCHTATRAKALSVAAIRQSLSFAGSQPRRRSEAIRT